MANETQTALKSTTYTPTAEQQAEFDGIFEALASWGQVGNKPASEKN